mmetsp:Transcript_8675/g.21414  ORF Transcript_8675/g.21414 Transcript_8675/m.21414 type:complete len:539 (+) Transcript_8675:186-1802(+)
MQTISNYTLLETVGQGTFGEVMLAIELHTQESVAVKILEKDKITDDDARQRLVNEIAILHRVQHPNLVQMLEVIEHGSAIYLVTEFVGGGELFGHIVNKGRLDEPEAMRLFAQMVAAVDSCHRQLVIHRDLKPENVLLDSNGDIKVIDFGLGTILSYADEVLTVACGSPHYAAPEMLMGGGYLGQRADMWSLGICLYAMLCGCLPFDEPEMDILYDRIIAGDFDFEPAPHISSAAKELICGMLHMPPEERLTARQVLNHRWLRAAAAPPPMSLGLLGAVVDPACRQLVRRMEADYQIPQREVIECLRRGERNATTATYWLLRQRELRTGSIQRYQAHLPKPPPPRLPSQRRRPVPANIAAAATKLKSRPLPALKTSHEVGLSIGFGSPCGATVMAASSGSNRGTARRMDDPRGSPGSIVQRPKAEEPIFVHSSGAVSDRTDRDGKARRQKEVEHGPVHRARDALGPEFLGVGKRQTAHAGGARGSQISEIRPQARGTNGHRIAAPYSAAPGFGQTSPLGLDVRGKPYNDHCGPKRSGW